MIPLRVSYSHTYKNHGRLRDTGKSIRGCSLKMTPWVFTLIKDLGISRDNLLLLLCILSYHNFPESGIHFKFVHQMIGRNRT